MLGQKGRVQSRSRGTTGSNRCASPATRSGCLLVPVPKIRPTTDATGWHRRVRLYEPRPRSPSRTQGGEFLTCIPSERFDADDDDPLGEAGGLQSGLDAVAQDGDWHGAPVAVRAARRSGDRTFRNSDQHAAAGPIEATEFRINRATAAA